MARSGTRGLVARALLDHPRVTDGIGALATGLAVAGWGATASGNRLRSALPAEARSSFYVVLASVAGPLLGFAIAAMSILVALPAGPRVDFLRTSAGWRQAPRVLAFAAGSFGVTTLLALVGVVVDGRMTPHTEYEAVVVAASMSMLLRTWALVLLLARVMALVVQDRPAAARSAGGA
jgi:hypothetical protein